MKLHYFSLCLIAALASSYICAQDFRKMSAEQRIKAMEGMPVEERLAALQGLTEGQRVQFAQEQYVQAKRQLRESRNKINQNLKDLQEAKQQAKETFQRTGDQAKYIKALEMINNLGDRLQQAEKDTEKREKDLEASADLQLSLSKIANMRFEK